MVGGLETLETNRRHSLSLALSSLADATANATTPLSTLLEREKTDIWRDRETVGAKQLWPYSKWINREILSAPKKDFVLLSLMPIKVLSGGLLVYGAMSMWPTFLVKYCSERQRSSPEDPKF